MLYKWYSPKKKNTDNIFKNKKRPTKKMEKSEYRIKRKQGIELKNKNIKKESK
mgnify:CR=1 FL=1